MYFHEGDVKGGWFLKVCSEDYLADSLAGMEKLGFEIVKIEFQPDACSHKVSLPWRILGKRKKLPDAD